MYKQVLDPVGNSLGWSSLVAVLPLVTLFVLLGGFKVKAWWAALASLAVAIIVAVAVYSMPFGQTMDSAAEGAVFGFFPIMWIVINAVWIYNMTRETGDFATLQRSFSAVTPDQRVQAVIIAFSFGALLEALAGFGTPVAICSVMLMGLGFKPVKAATVSLVANTAPVAFGAIAIPIVTLSELTGLPKHDVGAMVGRQTPFLALIVPLILIAIVDGRRGLRQAWPAALVGGSTFAVLQFATSNYISVELTDIIASLGSAAAIVALTRVWQPAEPGEGRFAGPRPAVAGASVHSPTLEREVQRRERTGGTPAEVLRAYAPYLVIIAVLAIAQIGPVKNALESVTKEFNWPGLHVLNGKGEAPSSVVFKFNYLSSAGTLLLISGLLTMPILRVGPLRAARIYGATLNQLKTAIITVMAVLALAYVMNLSGQTITLGTWAAGAGGFFAFLSPLIGWLGTAITGSDTSSNSLFGVLQVTAAKNAHLNSTLLAASNSSGGVCAKMVSPQNLAIGAAAVGMAGQEGELFRKVIGWSLLLVLLLAGLAYLQSLSALSWMVP
ncbi:MAG TPA: L-lactate permease [Thermoleophilaceae bacterium]|jgi:lactate permease|nr:L-lactate permease [Thermoleophilaceae bacterium]